MESKKKPWNKMELRAYILLLCANIDSERTEEEIKLIKSKIDPKTYKKIKKEISGDTEEESLKKIDENVQLHEYSFNELKELKQEMHEIFNSDKYFSLTERNLVKILNNILY